ncbi:hypothetical protein [Vagococcus fluvialis]|uniref:hypothetical protein n=1 Tax=Vagococcus fluvialis TaxID=2738 RepID=UPI001D0B1AF5|nr:hypothetical protein [Vagococcus fluvialis]UDM72425.1 hypothetical protein K5L00_06845 [Vagococcus fluvialis]UDM77290.1 hypothetical protein K5K98_02385 [Vagococcus fluvialis]UDM81560.1 hypothetical protein K5K96_09320 [Vagococcus fluvialis]
MEFKKLFGGKIMKKVYEGRIIGFGLILFVIGGLGFAKFGKDIFLSLIPVAMIWFMNYEFNSYEAKYGHERGEEE